MNYLHLSHNTPFQLVLLINLAYLIKNDDLVFSFSEIISNVNLKKYLSLRFKDPRGRLGFNPIDLLKAVLFGFTLEGYASLRKLEDLCRNDIRLRIYSSQ